MYQVYQKVWRDFLQNKNAGKQKELSEINKLHSRDIVQKLNMITCENPET